MPNSTEPRQCSICKKQFTKPCFLKRHMKRKTSCVPIITIDHDDPEIIKAKQQHRFCRFCNRSFASRPSCSRHMKDSCKVAPNEKNGTDKLQLLVDHVRKRDALERQAAIQQITDNSDNSSHTDNSGTITADAVSRANVGGHHNTLDARIQNMQKVTIINVFGRENISYIDNQTIEDLLDEKLDRKTMKDIRDGDRRLVKNVAYGLITDVTRLIYANKFHPENFTLFFPDDANVKQVMVHEHQGWHIRQSKQTFQCLSNFVRLFIFDKYEPDEQDYLYISHKISKIIAIPEEVLIPILIDIKRNIIEAGYKMPEPTGKHLLPTRSKEEQALIDRYNAERTQEYLDHMDVVRLDIVE